MFSQIRKDKYPVEMPRHWLPAVRVWTGKPDSLQGKGPGLPPRKAGGNAYVENSAPAEEIHFQFKDKAKVENLSNLFKRERTLVVW